MYDKLEQKPQKRKQKLIPKESLWEWIKRFFTTTSSTDVTNKLQLWLNRYGKVMNSFEFWLYLMNVFGLWRYRHIVLQLRHTVYVLFQLLWSALFLVDSSAAPTDESLLQRDQGYNNSYYYDGYNNGYNDYGYEPYGGYEQGYDDYY
jgi:hypothetical protein